MRDESQAIVLYDGVCGLCNRGVQFLVKRDSRDRLQFASLQSDFAAGLLRQHGLDHEDLDTVYAVLSYGKPNETLLAKGDAVLFFATAIGGIWNMVRVGRIVPRPVRNWLYDFIARHRYQVFGRSESCMLPNPKQKHKFIAV